MKYKKWAGIGAGIAGLTLSIHAQTYNAPEESQTAPPANVQTAPDTQPPPGTTYNASEQAQTTPPSDNQMKHDEDLYHANEFSVDLFAVGSLHESERIHGAIVTGKPNVKWGGGVGVNYFLTKYLGVGGDFYSITFKRSFVDTTFGDAIFRFPLGICKSFGIAPYLFGGAGYQFQGVDQIVGGGGGGVEFRLMPHFSIFGDVRYLIAVKTRNFGVGRAGVRFSF